MEHFPPSFAQSYLFDDPSHLGIADGEENVLRESGSLKASPASGPPWIGHNWNKSTVSGKASQVSAFSPPQRQLPVSPSPDQHWLPEEGGPTAKVGKGVGILLQQGGPTATLEAQIQVLSDQAPLEVEVGKIFGHSKPQVKDSYWTYHILFWMKSATGTVRREKRE